MPNTGYVTPFLEDQHWVELGVSLELPFHLLASYDLRSTRWPKFSYLYIKTFEETLKSNHLWGLSRNKFDSKVAWFGNSSAC